MTSTVKIKGMSCNHCVMAVTKALKGVEGINDARVDLQKGEARFDHDKPVDQTAIKKSIEGAGFEIG